MFIRPDWKDAKAYRENPNMTLSGGIAWEFLRRNPDYQNEIFLYESEVFGCCEQNPQEFIDTLEFHEWAEDFCSKKDFYKFKHPETSTEWYQFFQNKWGVSYPVRLNHSWSGYEFVCPSYDNPETFERVENLTPKGPLVLIPVDLSEPLELLLRKTEEQIRHLRWAGIDSGLVTPVTSRVLSNAVYIEYLRILDGIHAGETIQKIGEAVAPGAENDPIDKQRDKRIRAAYKAAQKMMNGGYRVLTF